MFCADFQERFAVLSPGKAFHWIRTVQGKSVRLGQGVPEMLEPDGCISFSFRKQQSHHFSERRDARASPGGGLSRALDELSDNDGETLLIRLATDHEFRKRFGRIQSQIPSLSYGHGHIQTIRC